MFLKDAFCFIPSMSDSSHLISAQDLANQLGSDNLVVIDARFSLADPQLGYRQYQEGHIPGAYYLNLDTDLSSPLATHGGRHPLPDWLTFVNTLNALGISSDPPTQVVVYDDSRFAFAARVWWMLRYLGHDQVALLDGGLGAWRSAGLPMSQDVPELVAESKRGGFVPTYQQNWTAAIEQVRQRSENAALIDSRSPERYRGEVEPIDPVAGSIPGAINAFWKDVSTENGFLRDADVLSTYWSQKGVAPSDDVMVYCGSGVTACVNLFSLVVAGHPMHRLYAGGWSDWCSYLDKS